MKRFIRSFSRHKGGLIGLGVLVAIFVLSQGAPVLFSQGPWDMVDGPFTPPSLAGPLLGTDTLGRDVATGIAYGARVSLLMGGVSTLFAVLLGTVIGAFAGYFGGRTDELLMGITEVFQTIPSFLLAVVLVAILTPSIKTIVLTIAVISWPSLARLVRAEFMSLRSREFVQAALLSGQSSTRIIFTQILPNALPPIIVSASLMVATAILLESGLSFLGLGDPNQMSWGFMIGASRTVMREAWWMSVFPGLAIVATVLALNMVGEALNDALNPKLRQGRSE